MKMAYRLGGVLFLFVLAALTQAQALAAGMIITGRVLTDDGQAAHLAKIEGYQGAARLTYLPESVDLQGRFKITLKEFSGTHLTCVISGRSYKPLKLTFVADRERLDLGDIVVQRLPSLYIGDATHSIVADQSGQSLDFYLAMQGAGTAEIRSVRLVGVRKKDTDCLTGAPSYVINLKQGRGNLWTASIQEPESGWKESIVAAGQVDLLPCEQIRAAFSVDASFQVAGSDRKKLRIGLPREVATKEGKRTLDIEQWDSLNIEFTLDDGSRVTRDIAVPGADSNDRGRE